MSWQQNQYNPSYSQGQWQPPPASYGQPYQSPPPQGGYNYQGPPPQAPSSGSGYHQQGRPPTSSVGPGASYQYHPQYQQQHQQQQPLPTSSMGPGSSYHYQQQPPQTSSYGSYHHPASSTAAAPVRHGGGPPYGAPPPGGPPPGVDPELWTWFQAVDDDKSGRITAKELRQALLNSNWSHFNAETCRLLIGMFDSNRDGTIDIHEFSALWKYVQEWKQCFDRFDKDRSGNIDANELRQALEFFGYRLSMEFCNLCTRVFDRQDKNTMKFDDFIQCCVMLRSLTEGFKRLDTNKSGIITVNYETFLEMAIDNTIQ